MSIQSTGVNINAVGSYTVTYSVVDPSGNPFSTTRTVNVVDTTVPVITLLGANPQVLECHSGYAELGATASDSCAGDLTSAISIDKTRAEESRVGSEASNKRVG